MKTSIEVQYEGNDVITKEVESTVREHIKSRGLKISNIETLDIYYKPQERSIYYVAIDKEGKIYGTNNNPIHF